MYCEKEEACRNIWETMARNVGKKIEPVIHRIYMYKGKQSSSKLIANERYYKDWKASTVFCTMYGWIYNALILVWERVAHCSKVKNEWKIRIWPIKYLHHFLKWRCTETSRFEE